MLLTEQQVIQNSNSFWLYTAWNDGKYHASYASLSRESITKVCKTLNMNWTAFKLLPKKIAK